MICQQQMSSLYIILSTSYQPYALQLNLNKRFFAVSHGQAMGRCGLPLHHKSEENSMTLDIVDKVKRK
jgi:hypothetical protein